MELIKISTITDSRGRLSFVESTKDIDFDIKRVYWLDQTTPGSDRGAHAHKKLHQLLIALSGSVTVDLDNGKEQSQIVLDTPGTGLIIRPMYWRDLKNFSDNAIVLVLASELYSEQDYYRNYEDFLHASRIS